MSIDGWMNKEIVVYIHNGILAIKKWNLAICDNMDGPQGDYAKWNKSDREIQIPYDFTHMWNIKTQNKWTYKIKQIPLW